MNKYTIRIGETVDEHKPVYLDLHKLVDTRALFEASSGQGAATALERSGADKPIHERKRKE